MTLGQSVLQREALIDQYLPKVQWLAGHYRERLPPNHSVEDLVQTGVLALLTAINNYDPSRNASLWTYAEPRVRGAMLDTFRGLDGVPHHKRQKAKQIQAAIYAAGQRLQHTPEESDIAAELGVTLREYQELLLEVRGVSIGSLDAVLSRAANESDLLPYIVDKDQESAADMVARAELEGMLADAIEHLPQSERTVISLYYHEEMNLAEIARIMNFHYSRISQLKAQAILRLRAGLEVRLRGVDRRAA